MVITLGIAVRAHAINCVRVCVRTMHINFKNFSVKKYNRNFKFFGLLSHTHWCARAHTQTRRRTIEKKELSEREEESNVCVNYANRLIEEKWEIISLFSSISTTLCAYLEHFYSTRISFLSSPVFIWKTSDALMRWLHTHSQQTYCANDVDKNRKKRRRFYINAKEEARNMLHSCHKFTPFSALLNDPTHSSD